MYYQRQPWLLSLLVVLIATGFKTVWCETANDQIKTSSSLIEFLLPQQQQHNEQLSESSVLPLSNDLKVYSIPVESFRKSSSVRPIKRAGVDMSKAIQKLDKHDRLISLRKNVNSLYQICTKSKKEKDYATYLRFKCHQYLNSKVK